MQFYVFLVAEYVNSKFRIKMNYKLIISDNK